VKFFFSKIPSQAWWQMPAIPATWEAEVGGSGVEAIWGKDIETLSEKQNKSQKSVAHTCNPSYLGG
jgi:hypothetical protein